MEILKYELWRFCIGAMGILVKSRVGVGLSSQVEGVGCGQPGSSDRF